MVSCVPKDNATNVHEDTECHPKLETSDQATTDGSWADLGAEDGDGRDLDTHAWSQYQYFVSSNSGAAYQVP